MMRKREATSWRAWWWPLSDRVRMARMMKLVPPAKSWGEIMSDHVSFKQG